MDTHSATYARLITRVTDDLAERYSATFTHETVEELVAQARTELESTTHHPEFVPALVEHYVRDVLVARAAWQGALHARVPTLLFVCEHNQGRSQMAAALAEHLGAGHVHVLSAGVHPTGYLNPHVVEALAERGITLERAYPSPLRGDVLHAADVVVRIGCQTTDESGRRYLDWQVDDPFEQPIEMVRRVRDELEERVRGLLAELEVPMREHVAEPVVGSPLARRRWMPARRPSLLSH